MTQNILVQNPDTSWDNSSTRLCWKSLYQLGGSGSAQCLRPGRICPGGTDFLALCAALRRANRSVMLVATICGLVGIEALFCQNDVCADFSH